MSFLPPLPLAHFGQVALVGIPSCAAIYYLVFFRLFRLSSFTPPLPPGPKPLPLIGNALDVPMGRPWLVFTQWAKHYGR